MHLVFDKLAKKLNKAVGQFGRMNQHMVSIRSLSNQ